MVAASGHHPSVAWEGNLGRVLLLDAWMGGREQGVRLEEVARACTGTLAPVLQQRNPCGSLGLHEVKGGAGGVNWGVRPSPTELKNLARH